jgi:hypothetical protein
VTGIHPRGDLVDAAYIKTMSAREPTLAGTPSSGVPSSHRPTRVAQVARPSPTSSTSREFSAQ